MALGFIGTGTIAAAMIEGLRLEAEPFDIIVSPRNAEVANGLALKFPNVRIAQSNQQVLDLSDTVVLAIRPQIAPEVLPALNFRPDHKVISLIATVSLDYLGNATAPAQSVTRAVPLPSVARGEGPTAIFPPNSDTIRLFDRIGTSFELADESEFDVFTTVTAVMATYFAFAHTVSHWMEKQGVSGEKAHCFTAKMLAGLSSTATDETMASFEQLAAEHQTRGGINEQVFGDLTTGGLICELDQSLDGILERLRRGRGR